jgi:uncharacterized protein (DUF433 family)
MMERSVISGFTEAQAARLTGVSLRQLRYWAGDGFFLPSLTMPDLPDLPDLRLYSFRDLVSLKVLNQLRNKEKIPLQELRRTKKALGDVGDALWTETTLYVFGKKVAVRNPKSGALEEATTGQGVLIDFKVVSADVQSAIAAMRQRRSELIGKIERKRGVVQYQPVIAGTRIPVASIRAFGEAGYTGEEIREQYPSLTIDDIKAALDYEAAA